MGVVLLVRHGQASFGADDYDVLSETGWAQSRLLGAHLAAAGVHPDAVVRGGMRRHRETASAMVEAAGWDVEPDADPGWDEFDHLGVVAALPDLPPDQLAGGIDRRVFQQVFEKATARWTSGEHDADYAESFAAFRARIGEALARATARAGSGATVVVVSSGGPIGAVCGSLVAPGATAPTDLWQLWGAFNTVVVNTSVTRLVVGASGPRLLTFNEHPHLSGETLTYR